MPSKKKDQFTGLLGETTAAKVRSSSMREISKLYALFLPIVSLAQRFESRGNITHQWLIRYASLRSTLLDRRKLQGFWQYKVSIKSVD